MLAPVLSQIRPTCPGFDHQDGVPHAVMPRGLRSSPFCAVCTRSEVERVGEAEGRELVLGRRSGLAFTADCTVGGSFASALRAGGAPGSTRPRVQRAAARPRLVLGLPASEVAEPVAMRTGLSSLALSASRKRAGSVLPVASASAGVVPGDRVERRTEDVGADAPGVEQGVVDAPRDEPGTVHNASHPDECRCGPL